MRALGERMIALAQRHRDESALRGGALGDAARVRRAHAERLFHEGQPQIEQVVRDLRHRPMAPERDHEVWPRLGQHPLVVGEDGGVAERRRALRRQSLARIGHRDEGDVRQRHRVAQVRRVVERVPVAHLDGGDPDRARVCHRAS